ncbi:MAG: FAD-dependent oxidoreductase [Gallionella sp.]
MHRLILAGGGHAHLSVLHALANHPENIEVTLITPSAYQTYSGMLPGWMAGHYSLSDCHIDLRPLAEAAGVALIVDQVAGMDANRNCVALSDGKIVEYDLLSLDVGGETDLSRLEALGGRLLPIKPLGAFVKRWPEIITDAAKRDGYSLIVVGGGAAGMEIAMAAQYAFSQSAPAATVTLIASENGILTGHAPAVIGRARKLLEQRGIILHQAQAVGVDDGVLLSTGQQLQADTVIATTGSTPPYWLNTSNLELDEHGYISVDANHRSISHHNIFAAGDVCARADTSMARSGVHAVFAGPVLANNLLASIQGQALQSYSPRKKSLYLLATGPKHAIVSWGWFSAQGHWVWRWKNWIDRGFISKHRLTPE